MTPTLLFAGPTLHGLDPRTIRAAGLRVLPPAKRGDITRAVSEAAAPGVLALADGVFHRHPSVGHAELRDAIGAGWTVWGVASMGAIRAAELSSQGMLGFGTVYQRYVTDPDFRDDEVALLHAVEPPFAPLTEPLIHIRALLRGAQQSGQLREEAAQAVLGALEKRWFGERTLGLVRQLLCKVGGLERSESAALVATIDEYRTKRQDLAAFLEKTPWVS